MHFQLREMTSFPNQSETKTSDAIDTSDDSKEDDKASLVPPIHQKRWKMTSKEEAMDQDIDDDAVAHQLTGFPKKRADINWLALH